MRSPGLLFDGQPAGVPVELAADRATRRRGLLGIDGIDGVLVLEPCRQVHTIGMRFPIDVAFCDRAGVVLRVMTMRPGRLSRVVWRSRSVLEGPAGVFAGWGLHPGVVVDLREHAAHDS
jgi:uncharacterized membrane protein (UPF0127 family)